MNRNKKIVVSAAIVIAIVSVIISINQTNTTLRNLFCAPCIEGSNNNLEGSKIIQVTGALGPESIAFDPNGDGPYTGVADGRILKWQGDELGWTEFAVTTSQRYLHISSLQLMTHFSFRINIYINFFCAIKLADAIA